MSKATERVEQVYQQVVRKNPAKPEFHQAVHEVLYSIVPLL